MQIGLITMLSVSIQPPCQALCATFPYAKLYDVLIISRKAHLKSRVLSDLDALFNV